MAKTLSIILFAALLLLTSTACRGGARSDAASSETTTMAMPAFDADSAYSYVRHQVWFGPRVPNTEAHRLCGDYLAAELKRHGAQVMEQRADIRAFDGTMLHARNIFGRINPEATDRVLLLAHYDSRPWADQDPDESRRTQPVPGANDGASGTGVLLEIARQLSLHPLPADKGVDILMVDAEDWGTDGNEDSWAMGTRYFMEHPIVPGYAPREAILLDMVGDRDAMFPIEYFSQQSNPGLVARVWKNAAALGYGTRFPARVGSAVTDDHIELIKAGLPAIDILDFQGGAFPPTWHTTADDMTRIEPNTLAMVGRVVLATLHE